MLELHLETTGYCNAACQFCIYPSDENKKLPKAHMTFSLFKKIVDEAATIPQIEHLTFAGLAEPLLDPLLVQRIKYAKCVQPKWRIDMFTNGVLLTPNRFDELKSAGLGIIIISLNAASQEQHERIMGLKGKYDLVCANADYAIANKGPMVIKVRAVADGDRFNLADARAFMHRWGSVRLGGYGDLIQEMNWANQLDRTIRSFDQNSTCARALSQISVHRTGHVNLCCLDPMNKHSWGDLNIQSIREIYNQPKYVEFREWHRDSQAAKHPVCADCTRV